MIPAIDLFDGRYRCLSELGRGAFGCVYRAEQVVCGHPLREVALKVLFGAAITPDNVGERMNEAIQLLKLLSELNDWRVRQHFLTVFDLGVTRGSPPAAFIAMELAPGGSLSGRLKALKRFTLAGTLHYLTQTARAIAYMHSRGFVHSDLKPDNILLFQSEGHDQIKVGDFGLAGVFRGRLDQDGPCGGTLSYSSAEQLEGLATAASCDVYALGLTALAMLQGEGPFDRVGTSLDPKDPAFTQRLTAMHADARKNGVRIERSQFPELRGTGPEARIGAALLKVIECMIAPDLAQRYASAVPLLADLERLSRGEFPDLKTGPAGETIAQKERLSEAADVRPGISNEFDFALRAKDWPRAEEILREVAQKPETAERKPLLEARLRRAQASHFPPAHRDAFLKKAAHALQEGLARTADAEWKRQLTEELEIVTRELGIRWA